MKKSLLALAVFGAFAGAASAQTSVTIYGIADAGINFDNSTNGRTWKLQSGQQSGSRLGFKGTEDLGGGLSAIFTLENGFNIDDGTLGNSGRLFGRQAWVGLNGGFGTVKLGRQQTPLYYAADAIDPFHINQAGNIQAAFGYGLYKTDPLSRSDNTITYSSQNVGGFTATVGYGFGEQPGAFTTGRSLLAGASYVNGPINVQFAYDRADTVAFAAGTALSADINRFFTGAGTASPATTADVKTAFIGGTYDFGVVKAHLAYGDTKIETTTGSIKDRDWLVGVSAPVGSAGSVQASWIRNDVRDAAAAKSNQFAVGYTHALSKRTNFYTSVGYTKNDANVRLNSSVTTAAVAPAAASTATQTGYGEGDRTFQVGVRHVF